MPDFNPGQLIDVRVRSNAPAYDEAGNEIASDSRKSFGDAARIRLTAVESHQLLEFTYSQTDEERTFNLEKVAGVQDVTFIFLPGSHFDFRWFRFER